MALVIIGIILISIAFWTIVISSDGDLKDLITILLIVLGVGLILNCANSNYLVNRVMKQYEQGNVKKEYTIIESDTTYKYVLKK